ncbi:hypothetical protein ACHAWT_006226 [Skeletonema menzelii]
MNEQSAEINVQKTPKGTKKNNERRALAQQLHNAAQVGNIQEIQAIFTKHQIPIDSHRRGNSALHTALYHNQDGLLLDYLIERGANVNTPNSKGYTPLDLAIVYCKRGKAVDKLIGAGAQWKERYSEESSKGVPLAFAGLTPLDIARRYNNQEVVDLLTARLLLHQDEANYCQLVSPSTSKGDTTSTINNTSPPINKWHSKCPICKDTVRFPTSMSRILLDQQLLEQKLQNANGVLLIDNKEKSGRNRKKYTARKYLDQFISHANGKAYEKLCGIEYHAVQNMRLRKEISESMGVLSAVQRCCYELNGGIDGVDKEEEGEDRIQLKNVFLIDLCSGRGLTTALGGALHDDYNDGDDDDDDDDGNGGNRSNNFFLSIDRMLPHTVPHFLQDGANRKYLSRDVLSESLFAELQEIVSKQLGFKRIPILVGMHLCGVLSERAVEFFERIPSIKGIVLSPCCLPKKHEQKKGITKFTKGKVDYEFLGSNQESGELYNYFKWNHYLKEMTSKSTPHVRSFTDDEMHTEKNAVVVGIRK